MNNEEINNILELSKNDKNLHHKKGHGGLLFITLSMIQFSKLKRYIKQLQQENEKLKSQLNDTTHCYDEVDGLDIKIDKIIEDINFCLHSIKQEMKISKDERTRSEMTDCYKILSVYEKVEEVNNEI